MCIIAIKPSGAKLPSDDTIRRMFTVNPHGAGFMFPYHGRVEIRKGFMTLDSFTQALHNVYDRLGKDAPIVMHFRITTHGGTCPENTHPFPLSKDIADMKRTSCNAKIGIAHNGIINIKTRDASVVDTQEYIASVMYPIYRRNHKFYKTQRILNGIRDTINGSRMAILTGDGKIFRIGTWVQDGDLWYSNSGFKPQETNWVYSWGDNDDYYSKTARTGSKRTYTSPRMPWEQNARIFVNIMPLPADETFKDSEGYMWGGFPMGIDRAGRLYELDFEDGIAYEAEAYIADDVKYERDKATYYEVA